MKQQITVVSGIGESTKVTLAEHGINSLAELANVEVEKLAAVKGFGPARARNAIAAARALLDGASQDTPATTSEVPSEAPTVIETPAKTSKKKKDNKENKKAKKNKKDKKKSKKSDKKKKKDKKKKSKSKKKK